MSVLLILIGLFMALNGNDFGWWLALIGFFLWMNEQESRRRRR